MSGTPGPSVPPHVVRLVREHGAVLVPVVLFVMVWTMFKLSHVIGMYSALPTLWMGFTHSGHNGTPAQLHADRVLREGVGHALLLSVQVDLVLLPGSHQIHAPAI